MQQLQALLGGGVQVDGQSYQPAPQLLQLHPQLVQTQGVGGVGGMYGGCLVGGVGGVQAVTVDGQDALFIPAPQSQPQLQHQLQHQPQPQPQPQGQLHLVNGQLVRAPLLPAHLLHNVMHLPQGGVGGVGGVGVRGVGGVVGVQVPVSVGGHHVYHTVHVPLHAPPLHLLPPLHQMQAQPQVANVLTPSGQIQQIQIASLANVQVPTLGVGVGGGGGVQLVPALGLPSVQLHQLHQHHQHHQPVIGQQIQQDPNEPGKWQVVTVSAASAGSAGSGGGAGGGGGGGSGASGGAGSGTECEGSKQRAGSPGGGEAAAQAGRVHLPQLRPGGEQSGGPQEAARLSHSGLQQGVWQDITSARPPALALRGAALLLQLAVLRQAIHAIRRAAASPSHAYGREAVRVSRVLQAIHALRSLSQARADTYQAPPHGHVSILGLGRGQRRRQDDPHDRDQRRHAAATLAQPARQQAAAAEAQAGPVRPIKRERRCEMGDHLVISGDIVLN
ncbi:unnamed protein product [Chilo suppressalis]|uniref:Uncharacterized protein n=1 Tax=Chilo suppressalis TaxID=168631 RepID=A0ABN8BBB0_CHISP|nr:unnamed protein product [Chilo suppressalis]